MDSFEGKIEELLERWKAPEPSPGFRTRFWEKVDLLERPKRITLPRLVWRLAPVLASIFIFIMAGSIFIRARIEKTNLVKDIELYQDLEIIQDMDVLADLEFLLEQNEYEG